jgi:hypothetical protein
LLVVALAASMGINAVFAGSSYKETARAQLAERLRNGPAVGDHLPPLVASQLGGGVVSLAYDGKVESTVIYVVRSSCVWCARNLSNFKSVARTTKAARVVVLALDQDEGTVSEYAQRASYGVPVYFAPSVQSLTAYGFGSTPMTVVVSGKGNITSLWPGAYVGSTATDIARFFDVKLPGLQTSAAHEEGGG